MHYESINVEHREYGHVTWYVVEKTKTTMTLIGKPIQERKAFYNPFEHEKAQYIRTNFSSSRKSNEPGTLYEVQNAPSENELDNENAQRYNDIVEYGSNQWAVSDLRHWLNENYFQGFPMEFRKRILPQKHDMVLSKTHVNRYMQGKTDVQYTSDNVAVYDEYCGNYRLTRCVVEDCLYLPSFEDREKLYDFIDFCDAFRKPMSFWLLDPAYEASVPYLVKCLAVASDYNGVAQANFGDCNARYPLHICPMCTVAISEEVEEQGKEDLRWIDIGEDRIARAKKVNVLSIDKETQHAECVGSKGERYVTTLTSCQCGDYIRKRSVCKHMIRLAMELGILNENGRTEEEQYARDLCEVKMKLAYWYGCYHLLNEPVVPDKEYDDLKESAKKDYGLFI